MEINGTKDLERQSMLKFLQLMHYLFIAIAALFLNFSLAVPSFGGANASTRKTVEKSESIGDAALRCPKVLEGWVDAALPPAAADLCALSKRYQQALKRLREKGYKDPIRIADALAPRFIDRPDWERARSRAKGVLSPVNIYSPAPETWLHWERAANLVSERAKENLRAQKIAPITEEHVLQLFRVSAKYLGIEGGYRDTEVELGRAWEKKYSMPVAQTEAIKNSEFFLLDENGRKLKTGKKLLEWHTTACLEERAPDFQSAYNQNPNSLSRLEHWPESPNQSASFTGKDGKQWQCGYILYPQSDQVPRQVKALLRDLNSKVKTWSTRKKKSNPIATAARAQRWLVAIHPFLSGNGRTSRFLADEILMSVNLPPPVLKDMNSDLGSSEAAWVQAMAEGILASIEVLERCGADESQLGCNEVPMSANN